MFVLPHQTTLTPHVHGANQQPFYDVEIDRTHRLYKNLRSAFYFGLNNTHEQSNLDFRNNELYPMAGSLPSNASFGVDQHGTHIDCVTTNTNGSDYGEIELNTQHFASMTEITILVGFVRTGDQDFGYGRLVSRSNGSSGDEWGATLNSNGGGKYMRWRVKGNDITGSTALSDNVFYDAAFTYKNGERDIYLDGESDASDSAALGSTLSDANPVSLFANPTSSNRAVTAKMYYVVIVDKVLSQSEIRQFRNDRFQLLKPVYDPFISIFPAEEAAGAPVAGSFGLLGVGI